MAQKKFMTKPSKEAKKMTNKTFTFITILGMIFLTLMIGSLSLVLICAVMGVLTFIGVWKPNEVGVTMLWFLLAWAILLIG